ncbi:hypothetical protein FRC09_014818 [Ceratobasidium sp. 395]|nr:hypothetical protein FRC09_014818 [Ceratobasidium sp. 395]
MTDAQKNIVRHLLALTWKSHSLKSFLSMCGLKHAHEGGRLVPQYDEVTGDPKYKTDKILVPRFDRSFEEIFDNGWNDRFYQVIRHPSRIKANKAFLSSVPLKEFRAALETGGFATMQDAWRRNKEGKGEQARVRKNQISRHAVRKNTKAERCGKALDES